MGLAKVKEILNNFNFTFLFKLKKVLKSKDKTLRFEVQSYHSDINSKLTLHQLFLFLQECAWGHAQENDFGYTFVEKENALWVLTRIYVKLNKYPKWEEHINIKTWPKTPEGLFAFRDFEIKIGEEVVGQVVSSWLVVDKKTRRPRRLSDFEIMNSEFNKQNAIDHPLEKLEMPELMEKVAERKVQWSDIDVNAHVNNATYVRWAMDAIFKMRGDLPMDFEINYLRELKIHDDFQVYISNTDTKAFLKITDSNGKEICLVRASFSLN